MMNVQRQAWEQYLAEKGIPMEDFKGRGGMGGLYSDSLVDNQDPISDISESSRSTSRSRSNSSDYQSGSAAHSDSEYSQASAQESVGKPQTPEEDSHTFTSKEIKKHEKRTLEEFANLERLKLELEAKKRAFFDSASTSKSSSSKALKRRSTGTDDECVPVKKVTRYEKGKKVVKIIKKRKKSKMIDAEAQGSEQAPPVSRKPKGICFIPLTDQFQVAIFFLIGFNKPKNQNIYQLIEFL